MCYYNGVKVTKEQHIRLRHLEKLVANYDFLARPLMVGFDYGYTPVLKRVEGEEDFDIVPMEWGFLPPYIRNRESSNQFRLGYKKPNGQWQEPIMTLNAISEEFLNNGKMYRDSGLHRRCLVLSTGFYEWRHVFPIGKKTGKPLKTAVKYPYRVMLRDREYYFMAGIWTPWKDAETGEYAETVTIVTTKANPLMEQVHNIKKRMPTILTDVLAWEWLFGELPEDRIKEIGQFQFPSELMEAYPIARDFRDQLDPTTPFVYEELPELVE